MDVIEVSDLTVDCIVGVLEREQRSLQRLIVDLRLELELEAAGERADLAASVDYAHVAEQARILAEHGRFRLVETYALALCRLLLLPPAPVEGRAAVQRVTVRVRKPDILAPLCVPGLQMSRDAGSWRPEDVGSHGLVEEHLVRVQEAGVSRVRLACGTTWRTGDRATLVLAGVIEVAGRRFHAGERIARGVGDVHAVTDAVIVAVGLEG